MYKVTIEKATVRYPKDEEAVKDYKVVTFIESEDPAVIGSVLRGAANSIDPLKGDGVASRSY